MIGYKILLAWNGLLYSRHELRQVGNSVWQSTPQSTPDPALIWRANEWREAHCLRKYDDYEIVTDMWHPVPLHAPPFLHTDIYGCGFHACYTIEAAKEWGADLSTFDELGETPQAVAMFELAGEIITGTKGMMAQQARLLGLLEPPTTICGGILGIKYGKARAAMPDFPGPYLSPYDAARLALRDAFG